MTVDKRLLRERAKIRKKRPKFRRQESWRYKRLRTGWRRPVGIDNTMRHHKRGWPKIVRIGFRGPKSIRGLTSNGKVEVLVHNVKEIEQIDVDVQIARIASAVGIKKKVDMTNRADELNVKIINRPEEALTFATISEISEELLLEDDVLDKKKKSSRPRKKKSSSSGLTAKEIAELDQIESQLAGKEKKSTKKPTKKSTTKTKAKPTAAKKTASVKKTTVKPKATKSKKTTTAKPKTTTAKKPTAAKKTTAKSKVSITAKKTTSTTKKKTATSKKAADTKKKAASSKKN